MSDSTWSWSHWPTRSGPRSPAASVAKRRPSTRRAPSATGSTARRAHARSRYDSAGSTSTSTRSSATQQLDGALGDDRRPGHRVEDLAVLGGAPPRAPRRWRRRPRRRSRRCRRGRRRSRRPGTAAAAGWRRVRSQRCGTACDARRACRRSAGRARPAQAHDDDPRPIHRVRARRAVAPWGVAGPSGGSTRPVARSKVP